MFVYECAIISFKGLGYVFISVFFIGISIYTCYLANIIGSLDVYMSIVTRA